MAAPKEQQYGQLEANHPETESNELLEKDMSLFNNLEADVEAGKTAEAQGKQELELEYQVPAVKKFVYLGAYFSCSMFLTLYNKLVLGKFPFPWLLTAVHSSFAAAGCYALMVNGHFRLTTLSSREKLILVLFSFLFTINIAISNVSLAMVSVPFHQIMRSTCPIFTVLIYRVYYSRSYGVATYWSLVPVIIGAAMSTSGSYTFTDLGFLLTLLGVVLASLKTVATNRLMTGTLALPPLEILLRMSPLAAMQSIAYAAVTGELSAFGKYVAQGNMTLPSTLAVAGNGFLALVLNITSFQTNKLAGALTMTVCANIKQSATVALGIFMFDVHVGLWSGAGMLVTLAGAALYSKVELDAKSRKKQQAAGV